MTLLKSFREGDKSSEIRVGEFDTCTNYIVSIHCSSSNDAACNRLQFVYLIEGVVLFCVRNRGGFVKRLTT